MLGDPTSKLSGVSKDTQAVFARKATIMPGSNMSANPGSPKDGGKLSPTFKRSTLTVG